MPIWLWLPLLLLFILAGTVVVLPLSASFAGELGPSKTGAVFEGYWGAKSLVGVFFSTESGITEFRILGRRFRETAENATDEHPSGPDESDHFDESDLGRPEDEMISPPPRAEEPAEEGNEFVEPSESRIPEPDETAFEEEFEPQDTENEYRTDYQSDQPERISDESNHVGPEDLRETFEPGEDFGSKQSEKGPKQKKGRLERLRKSPILFVLRRHRYQMKILKWLKRIIIALFRIVRFDTFRVRISGNLGDPVVMGLGYGIITSLQQALRAGKSRPYLFLYEPEFDMDTGPAGHAAIKLHTSLIRILFPLIIALATFPYLSTAILYLRLRKRIKAAKEEGAPSPA